jgi:hypothetical protein
MWTLALKFLIVFSGCTQALFTPQARQIRNDGIHLAVGPKCGPLGGKTADVIAGFYPLLIKTIVSFGVRVNSHVWMVPGNSLTPNRRIAIPMVERRTVPP